MNPRATEQRPINRACRVPAPQAGFIRRSFVARAFMPGRPGAREVSAAQYEANSLGINACIHKPFVFKCLCNFRDVLLDYLLSTTARPDVMPGPSHQRTES
jgi:hypothetical protein